MNRGRITRIRFAPPVLARTIDLASALKFEDYVAFVRAPDLLQVVGRSRRFPLVVSRRRAIAARRYA